MSRFVLDASVVMKWFVPEVHGGAALRFLDETHELHAPDLFHLEATNTLWKKRRRGEISTEEGRKILDALATAPIQVHASAPLAASAYEVAVGTGRSVYDACYVALAAQLRCPMVTADRTLVIALASGPLARHVLWVEDGSR